MTYFISGVGPGEAGSSNFYSFVNDIAKTNNLIHLSMGMSGDYIEGLKCGASYIRVGTLLFGNREYEN